MKPKFTDTEKHPNSYASAEQSRKPGYLRGKFAKIRAAEEAKRLAAEAVQAETTAKVRDLKRAAR